MQSCPLGEERQSKHNLFPEKAGFIQLLLDTPAIKANSTWNESEQLIVTDPRYQAVYKDVHKRQWFSQYVEQLKKVDFIQLLLDKPEITKHSKFHKSKHFIETDPRFNAVDTVREKKKLFSQYVEKLADNGNEDIKVFLTFDLLISIEGPRDFLCDKPVLMGNQIKLRAEMEEFANWTKCVLAQTRTRDALQIVVTKLFDMFIKRTIDGNELLVFLECMKNQNVCHIKVKRKTNADKKSTWKCEHSTCAHFFKTLLEHYVPKQTDRWHIHTSTETKQDKKENKGSIPNTKASPSPEEEAKQDDERTLPDNILWPIIKLFVFSESQNEDDHCQSLHGLDISQMIKLQRCCILVEFDGSVEIYNDIIANRNKLMHSEDNLVSSEDLEKIFGTFCSLLEVFGKEFDVCAGVITELKTLEKSLLKINVHDMMQTFQEEAIQAFETKERALHNDISNPDDISYPETKSVSDLKRLLKETQEEKRNLANKMKEVKLEIEKLTELNSDTITSNKSVETVLRYVYLAKDDDQNETTTKQKKEKRISQISNPYLLGYLNIEKEKVKRLQEENRELELQLKRKDEEITASIQKRDKRILQLKTEKEELTRRAAAADVMHTEENRMKEIQIRMKYIDEEIASLE